MDKKKKLWLPPSEPARRLVKGKIAASERWAIPGHGRGHGHPSPIGPGPGPMPKPRSREEIENVYSDFEFWQDNVEYPDGYRLMDQSLHPEWYEHIYTMSAADKTEMTATWLKVWYATYGGIQYQLCNTTSWNGFVIVRDGRYYPSEHAAGRCVNNDDWSTKYNAVRGVLWEHWLSTNPSDQHNYVIGQRPTIGSVDFGNLMISVDRNYNYQWRLQISNGNGTTTQNYVAGAVNISNDSSALQWEFVKGSHITLKMYVNVHNTVNFSTFTMPTWPITATGNYVTVDLTGTGLNALTPISPVVATRGSVEYSNGRIGLYAYELRALGGDWGTLV
jgi:hypothetical protein